MKNKNISRIVALAKREKELEEELSCFPESIGLKGWTLCPHNNYESLKISAWKTGDDIDNNILLSLNGRTFVVESFGQYSDYVQMVMGVLNENRSSNEKNKEDSWLWTQNLDSLDSSETVEYVRIDLKEMQEYPEWRISYQSSEQAAKSAYKGMIRLLARNKELVEKLEDLDESFMCDFGTDILTWIKDQGGDIFEHEDSETIMEIAAKHGLAKLVTYNPGIHGDIDNAEEVKKAFNAIKAAMQADSPGERGSYAYGWHCNMAMMCYNAIAEAASKTEEPFNHDDAYVVANDAASRFMKLCFDVETKA